MQRSKRQLGGSQAACPCQWQDTRAREDCCSLGGARAAGVAGAPPGQMGRPRGAGDLSGMGRGLCFLAVIGGPACQQPRRARGPVSSGGPRAVVWQWGTAAARGGASMHATARPPWEGSPRAMCRLGVWDASQTKQQRSNRRLCWGKNVERRRLRAGNKCGARGGASKAARGGACPTRRGRPRGAGSLRHRGWGKGKERPRGPQRARGGRRGAARGRRL